MDFETGLLAAEELKQLVPEGNTLAQFALRWILMHPAVLLCHPGRQEDLPRSRITLPQQRCLRCPKRPCNELGRSMTATSARRSITGGSLAALPTGRSRRGLDAFGDRNRRSDRRWGTGGVAGALAALRLGRRVVLTEETDWIGGQLTAQAVPPDEHPWIEEMGCTASYRRLRNGIRDFYRRNYPLMAGARGREHLNPGDGLVSRLCHEPRAALAVLEGMLSPTAPDAGCA